MKASIAVIKNNLEVIKAQKQGYNVEKVFEYSESWLSLDRVDYAYRTRSDDEGGGIDEVRIGFSNGEEVSVKADIELIQALDNRFKE